MALWTNVDNEAGKPKFLNTTEKAATLGISPDETANQKATHAGWVLSTTGTGGRSGRVFNETLVAMGSMTGDNDTVDPDPVITIGTQPQNISVIAPATATFTVAATATRGATLSYQWQIQQEGAGAFTNISGATSASYTTGATAIGDGAGATDGDNYRVIVSATGATAVTSNAATLTVTEE
jgi:hypothetical protein